MNDTANILAEVLNKPTFNGIRPGDRVTYSDSHGKLHHGKARICQAGHVVLNIGGRFGTPQVVNESNYACHRPGKA